MVFVLDRVNPLTDEPVALKFVGARPRRVVRLRAECSDSRGVVFKSWAEYLADGTGMIDPGNQAPRLGTYKGRDAFGLWWSMRSMPEQSFARDLKPVLTTVVAEIGRECVAHVHFERARIGSGVRVENVRNCGLVAKLFLPNTQQPAPGVMVLGGSEGGIAMAQEIAALLASRGFVCMALAYFGVEGLPPQLAEIPLEYVESSMHWFLRRPELAGVGIGIIGSSRGGELALLLASTSCQIHAVVGLAASSILWPGYTPGALHPRPAWTRGGIGLPFLLPEPQPSMRRPGPLATRAWFARAMQNAVSLNEATIPVERIRAAVMLISGEDDNIWPSDRLAQRAMNRLALLSPEGAQRHFHLSYPQAGHRIGYPPGLPESSTSFVTKDGITLALGGSRSGNARAAQGAWPRMIDFLADHLGAAQHILPARKAAP